MVMEVNSKLIGEVKVLLKGGDREAVKVITLDLHFSDIAHLMDALDESDAIDLFGMLPPDVASEVIVEVDERLRKALIQSISHTELVEVVDEMETDDAADVIGELPSEDARQVLEGIDRGGSIKVKKLLGYREDTAGGKMQAELVSVKEDVTVEETIREVRRRSHDIENISNVYVVDYYDRLVGVVPLTKLILAMGITPIKALTGKEVISVETDLDQEEVARIFQRYDLIAMPVVDKAGRLVGRITVDDVVDVIEEEIVEDFYKIASLSKGERASDPPFRSFILRAPWLLINLVTAFVAATVIKVFEGTIETLVILAVLMPVVAGLGGNAATQSITIIVRGLALGELKSQGAMKVILKEGVVGLANGLLIGIVAAFTANFFGASPAVGLLLFLAMTANLVIAGLSGSVIPLLLKRLNMDPALSASIFVTAFTDVGGFFTFLGLAALFMQLGIL